MVAASEAPLAVASVGQWVGLAEGQRPFGQASPNLHHTENQFVMVWYGMI